MKSETDPFDAEKIAAMAGDQDLARAARSVFDRSCGYGYSYNFSWLGRPIIQYPQDIVAMQEIIWRVRPDLIIETGVALGGSLVFYASMLELLGAGQVIGIDIDIRAHNRKAIEAHSMTKRIELIQGSSISPEVFEKVQARASTAKTVLVALDSSHTHEHVLAELRLYSRLVTPGSYLVVFDTVIEDMPANAFPDRPWGIGNNPKTAVREFLKQNSAFEVDRLVHEKLLLSVAPEGYLRRVRAEDR
jgi:cephalosporin hydroxylase